MNLSTENIETDEVCKEFLADQNQNIFNDSLTIAEQIKKLSDGLDAISSELQRQVREQHGALLSQASHAGKLTVALDAVSGHMERLKNGAERLKSQVNGSYAQLENQTHVLERLHDASHLLRQAGRFLQLHRQLKCCKNKVEQAKLYFEIETFLNDELMLAQIEFLREEREMVLMAKKRFSNECNDDLLNGLKKENQSMVLTSLQILFNLQILPKYLDNLLDTFISDIKVSIKQCFSEMIMPRRMKKADTVQVCNQSFHSKLWLSLEWLFDEEIVGFCQQIVFLQKSLENIHGNAFIVASSSNNNPWARGSGDIEQRFWVQLETELQKLFVDCSMEVLQELQQELPRLLANARGLQAKFGGKFFFSDSVFQHLQAGYLKNCCENFADIRIGVYYLTELTVDAMVKVATKELSAAMVDARLCLLVANIFNSFNMIFFTQVESYIHLSNDSQKVVDIPNEAQIENKTVAKTVCYHSDKIKRLIQNLGPNFANSDAANTIVIGLNKGKTLITAIVQEFLESMNSAVNKILLSMHREPGFGLYSEKPLNSTPPSLYMKELQEFIRRTWSHHITPFLDAKSIGKCSKKWASRWIEMFIRNVAIMRPISMDGRKRLKSDCQYLETALRPIVNDISTLGKPYRQLNALATAITMSPEELSNQTSEPDGLLPMYIVLFLLFSHVTSMDLTSPHSAAGFSIEHFLEWLDDHTSDKERLELVTEALQKYRIVIQCKYISHYDPVYPLILSCLENAYKHITISKK